MHIQNRSILIIFSTICWLLFSTAALAEQPRFCPANTIRKDQISSIIERRKTTFQHCLTCVGESCELKTWPASGKDFAQACKLLFCTPTKRPQKSLLPQGADRSGGYRFTYTISKKGRVKDVEVLDLMGDVTQESARKLIRSFFERRRYEPIVVDGKSYELTNLVDGTNFKMSTTVRTH